MLALKEGYTTHIWRSGGNTRMLVAPALCLVFKDNVEANLIF